MNSSFSSTLPNLQLAWDSTSLGALKECPRKYYYSIIQGWSPRVESVHLTFGQYYHSALEAYDHAKFAGATHDEATVKAVRRALQDTWNKTLNRPWTSDIKEKNRETLVRTVVWYLEQFKEDPLQTVRLANGKPAVELSFRFESGVTAPTGENYLLCGHLDRVAMMGDDGWILDRKTSKYSIDGSEYFERYSPDNQMSMYDFAGKIVYNLPIRGVIVDAAQVLITLSRFRRGTVPRTDSTRNEWFNTTTYYIKMAASYVQDNFWPMNDKSCGMYGGCPFRPICGRAPEVREQWLQATFKKRIWDPLQVRGDI